MARMAGSPIDIRYENVRFLPREINHPSHESLTVA